MSVDEVVQDRIIRVWESNDEQVHFQTIGDRVMADESIAGAMLGMYQRVLTDGGVGIDGSAEQIALRLTGAVVKRGDRILVMNRIYEGVFGKSWVAGKLEALRPYGERLRKWLESSDDIYLLQRDELRQGRRWAFQKNRKLAPEDYRFLELSSSKQRQEELISLMQMVQGMKQSAKDRQRIIPFVKGTAKKSTPSRGFSDYYTTKLQQDQETISQLISGMQYAISNGKSLPPELLIKVEGIKQLIEEYQREVEEDQQSPKELYPRLEELKLESEIAEKISKRTIVILITIVFFLVIAIGKINSEKSELKSAGKISEVVIFILSLIIVFLVIIIGVIGIGLLS